MDSHEELNRIVAGFKREYYEVLSARTTREHCSMTWGSPDRFEAMRIRDGIALIKSNCSDLSPEFLEHVCGEAKKIVGNDFEEFWKLEPFEFRGGINAVRCARSAYPGISKAKKVADGVLFVTAYPLEAWLVEGDKSARKMGWRVAFEMMQEICGRTSDEDNRSFSRLIPSVREQSRALRDGKYIP